MTHVTLFDATDHLRQVWKETIQNNRCHWAPTTRCATSYQYSLRKHGRLTLKIQNRVKSHSWWRHQMETFSALLALCAGHSPVMVNSPHKGQWREAFMFSLICAWINDWVNNREADDLRRHRGHYDVNVMITRDTPSYTSDRLCHIWEKSTQEPSCYRAARKMCSTLVIFVAKSGPNLTILSNVLACDETCHATV